ncbi:hypothetical protein DFJ58DRAFT_733960 [Suillus subalutaceus]|uniref:uncharacterized protein n=1 Tax=Suillus subalutaceus TaxID=48586 RepID=UPI001B86504A|nr:uncharacterized protein DFJ58DRAFT_733960 [Suillus subalutaceus]KAG1838216.1 hypothetical protein DFJ58DRAFT_733960 [Suillus subalutaceus]
MTSTHTRLHSVYLAVDISAVQNPRTLPPSMLLYSPHYVLRRPSQQSPPVPSGLFSTSFKLLSHPSQMPDVPQLPDGEIEEESRELTHEEIWDGSALIDAWNSATAEYEVRPASALTSAALDTLARHSTGKRKTGSRPLSRNPLFSKKKAKTPNSTKLKEEDSAPLDFDTVVPSYDPSPPVPSEASTAPESSFFIPASSTTMVSRDEAFSRALSAMYWGGYWTAVYHCQNRHSSQEAVEEQDHQEYEEDDEVLEDDAEDLVP